MWPHTISVLWISSVVDVVAIRIYIRLEHERDRWVVRVIIVHCTMSQWAGYNWIHIRVKNQPYPYRIVWRYVFLRPWYRNRRESIPSGQRMDFRPVGSIHPEWIGYCNTIVHHNTSPPPFPTIEYGIIVVVVVVWDIVVARIYFHVVVVDVVRDISVSTLWLQWSLPRGRCERVPFHWTIELQ